MLPCPDGLLCPSLFRHKDEGLEQILAAEGACWKDVLAEYECDICFEVLVGVHVLGESSRKSTSAT